MAQVHPLGKYIDHTLLKPDATVDQIDQLCKEASDYEFASVCVNPNWVRRASVYLAPTKVHVASVVGFPLGANSTKLKRLEAQTALDDGAQEFDMVMNIGALKSSQYGLVLDEIREVVDAVEGMIVKVIIENCYLTEDEKRVACLLVDESGAHFIKTSTGFGPSGATIQDVMLMRSLVRPSVSVKAAGGIRDSETALKMIEAGASRLGTSSGVKIMTDLISKIKSEPTEGY